MTVDQLIAFYKVKNKSQLAKKIKKGRSTMTEWETNGIPPKSQAALEILTKGKLKADPNVLTA
ncbi:hypothetical protein [Acinetobacter pittii]|uniref:hypothetical protein n=1 Tax=Acinetobacter pittii TaxID=48296 RepID=UPI0024DE01C8|nr:hypothetical protein [Acinetobacter pittii]